MNLGQLRDLASLFVGDPNQTRFTSSQYTAALNRGQEQFAFDTRSFFKDASTITVVDGTAAYSLPSDFLWEKKVTHKGLKLEPISRETIEFYKRSDDWSDDTGTPKYFVIDPEEARKTITLFPIPKSEDAGANLILTYYPIPTALADGTDTPFNGYALLAPYHIAVAAYAAWLMTTYETQTPEIMAKRGALNKVYQDKATEAADHFQNTASENIRLRGGRAW